MTHFFFIRQLILLLHNFDFFSLWNERKKVFFLSFFFDFTGFIILDLETILSDSVGPGSKLIGTIFSIDDGVLCDWIHKILLLSNRSIIGSIGQCFPVHQRAGFLVWPEPKSKFSSKFEN